MEFALCNEGIGHLPVVDSNYLLVCTKEVSNGTLRTIAPPPSPTA